MVLLAASGKVPAGQLLALVGGLIVAVVIMGLIVLKVRGSMLAKDAKMAGQEGLMAGLRRMRDAGEITPEEYEAAKRTMVARAAGTPKPQSVKPSGESRARPGFDLTGAPLPKPPPSDVG